MKIIKATKTDLESLESLCENCFPSEATTQINFTNTDDTYLLYKNSSLIGSISFQNTTYIYSKFIQNIKERD